VGKYICPYCGEQEDFIIDQEYVGEFGIDYYDRRVRCGNCYRIFNDDLSRELSDRGFVLLPDGETPKTTRNRLKFDGLRLYSREYWRGMRAQFKYPQNPELAANCFQKALEEFPDRWETVFYHALFTIKTNTPIQNITYYKIFATKVSAALNMAAQSYKDTELKISVGEIVEESLRICRTLDSHFLEVAERYINGEYPDALRAIVSMDVALIYDVLAEFIYPNKNFYSDAVEIMNKYKMDHIDFFGFQKGKIISTLLQSQQKPSWSYPIEYFIDYNGNKTYNELISIPETKFSLF
jgi:hypothetical protein